MGPRIYTPREASALVPKLIEAFDDIDEVRNRLKSIKAKIDVLEMIWGEEVQAETNPDHKEYAHYAEEIELDDLAGMAHMSKRSFLRTFQAATGESPIAYLIQIRVNRAADRLRATGDSVTEVAFAVGFRDSNYFARQFRRVTGLTPRAYRAANRG